MYLAEAIGLCRGAEVDVFLGARVFHGEREGGRGGFEFESVVCSVSVVVPKKRDFLFKSQHLR